MEVKTKQRWAGLLILIAILAIFLPLVFHNTNPTADIHSVSIPAKPALTIEPPTSTSSSPPAEQSIALPAPTATNSTTPMSSTIAATVPEAARVPAAANATNTVPAATETSAIETTSAAPLNPPVASPAAATTTASISDLGTWCIQLGTFENIDHANLLIQQLRAKGFDAYTRPVLKANGQHWLRVYVGPEVRKDSALRLKDQLEVSFHLKGIVTKYTVA